jgi:hypothetical protein
MTESLDFKDNPLIGFFPPFHSLADTGRLVMIAKQYEKMGGKAIFFSHGGRYEYLAKDNGFNIIQVNPIFSEKEFWDFTRDINLTNFMKLSFFSKKWIEENVRNEIEAYKSTGIKMLIFAYFPTCSISSRVVKIPNVSIVNDMGCFSIRAPDVVENFLTRLIPQYFKIRILNWYLQRSKIFLGQYNKVAKKFKIPPFKCLRHVFHGDITLETNALEFINIFPNQQFFPNENYVGPIFLDKLFQDGYSEKKQKLIDSKINSQLNRSSKSILVTLGSVGHKKLFLRILKVLKNTNYNVIAQCKQSLNKNEVSNLSGNILIEEFIPFISKIHKTVDISIIHGGQGTVYAAAYAGKPVIGIPMQGEQHRNLEKIVGHGSGIMLSKKFFNEEKLHDAINEIFNNYEVYLANAENLANKLPSPEGDKNVARRIIEIQKFIKK